ncbi:MAG: AAA family ATPase [Candidatus Binatia bacterium]
MPARVISITRSLASGDKDIGRIVADELGFSFLDNEIIQLAAEKAGVSPEEVDRAEHTKPLLARIHEVLGSPSLSISTTHPMESMSQEQLISPPPSVSNRQMIQKVIYEAAEKGNVVIAAHASGFHLAGMEGLLRVFVIASVDVRVERLRQMTKLNAQDARRAIEKDDKERQSYLRRFYDVRQELPTHYDLVINTDMFTSSVAAHLIVTAAKS